MSKKLTIFLFLTLLFFTSVEQTKALDPLDIKLNPNIIKTLVSSPTPSPISTPTSSPTPEPTSTPTPKLQSTIILSPTSSFEPTFTPSPTEASAPTPVVTPSPTSLWQLSTIGLAAAIVGGLIVFILTRKKEQK